MRPPMSSDSEDDYDGFSFGNEFEKPKERKTMANQWLSEQRKVEEDLNQLLHFVKIGNIDGIKEKLLKRYYIESKINYDEYLKDGWTLLMYAIFNLQFEVVLYLINKGADINCQVDSLTPLMLICKSETHAEEKQNVLHITKLLVDSGANINQRDKTGCTPLMYACSYGNNEIVDLILKSSAIDSIDNSGFSAIHYACQNKHIEIVKVLLEAGAQTDVANAYGLTPRDVAVSVGCTEIEALFPEDIVDDVPLESEQYRTYHDIAPTIFPDHDLPPYSQNIPTMLRGMRAEICGMQFYNAKISLPEFLTIDDDHLKAIGINFEYQRKRILHGLLKFHRHPYSPNSITFISQDKHKNFFQYYEVFAGYLKHLIIMQSAIEYFLRIGGTENVHQRHLQEMLSSLDRIQKDVALLHTYVQHVSKFSKKNPLFIGSSKKHEQRYKRIFRPFLTYTIIIGVGIFLSYRLSKLFA